MTGEVGDGSCGMNAICSRPEVADNVIVYGTHVDGYLPVCACVNLCVAILSSFLRKSKLVIWVCNAKTTVGPLESHF